MNHTIEIEQLETIFGTIRAEVNFSVQGKYESSIESIICKENLNEVDNLSPKVGEDVQGIVQVSEYHMINNEIYEYMANSQWSYDFGKAVIIPA